MKIENTITAAAIKTKAFAVSAYNGIARNIKDFAGKAKAAAARTWEDVQKSWPRPKEPRRSSRRATRFDPFAVGDLPLGRPDIGCFYKNGGGSESHIIFPEMPKAPLQELSVSSVYTVVKVSTKLWKIVALVEAYPWRIKDSSAFHGDSGAEVLRGIIAIDAKRGAGNRAARLSNDRDAKALINDSARLITKSVIKRKILFDDYDNAYAKYLLEAQEAYSSKPATAKLWQFVYDGEKADSFSVDTDGGSDSTAIDYRQILNAIELILDAIVDAIVEDIEGVIYENMKSLPAQFRFSREEISNCIGDLVAADDSGSALDNATLTGISNILAAGIISMRNNGKLPSDESVYDAWRDVAMLVGGGSLLNAWVNATIIEFYDSEEICVRNGPRPAGAMEDNLICTMGYVPAEYISETREVDAAGLYNAYRNANGGIGAPSYNPRLYGDTSFVRQTGFKPLGDHKRNAGV